MHIVVAGGYTESKDSLERVADTAVRLGLGHDAEDKVFLMRNALGRDEEAFRRAARGAHVITHSGGALALADVARIEVASIVAAPEPRSVLRLGASAVRKTLNHLIGASEHPRRDHLHVVAGNTAELILHGWANSRHIPAIGRFSTIDSIREGLIQADRIGYFPHAEDEFFGGLEPLQLVALNGLEHVSAAELPGRHDELLVDPAGTLSLVQALHGGTGQPSAA